MWALWLSLPYFMLGSHSYIQIHDNADGIFSALVGYSRGLPFPSLWESRWVAGVDWLAQGMTSGLYAFPFLILPAWTAYALLMVAQRFVAGYFSYRVLRDLGCKEIACLYAGLAYSLFVQPSTPGFTLLQGLGEPAFPLVLWATTRKAKSPRLSYAGAAVLGIAYALFSSFPLAMFVFPLVVIWIAFVAEPSERKHASIRTCFLTLGWLIAEAPVLAAAALNAPDSHRAHWATSVMAAGGGLRQAAIYTFEYWRYNAISIGLVVLALVICRERSRRLAWLSSAFVVCSLAPILWFFIDSRFHTSLGFLAGFQWSRFSLAAPLLAVSAAAFAISALLQSNPRSQRLWWAAAAAIGLVVGQSIFLEAQLTHATLEGSNYHEIYDNHDLLALSSVLRTTAPPPRVASFGRHPAFMWGYGAETVDGYTNLYSRRYQQFWELVIEASLRRDPAFRTYFEEWGNRVYLFSPQSRDQSPVTAADHFDVHLLSLANVKYLVSAVPLAGSDLVLLPSSVRQKQLEWQRKPRWSRYKDVVLGRSPGAAVYVYENKRVLARAFCAEQVILEPSAQDSLNLLKGLDMTSLRKIVIAETPGILSNSNHEIGTASIDVYTPSHLKVLVNSSSGCPLVVTNNYSRYWSACIDGKRVTIGPADYTFQVVQVPAGKRAVEFSYAPPYGMRRSVCSE